MYDYMVVGCGLFGSVFSNIVANKGFKVLIIDKRNHIAGNCYTESVEGIEVHKYGPHIFHTNSKEIWDYVNKFTEFKNFILQVKANFDDKLYSLPINLNTFNELWGVTKPDEAKRMLERNRVKIDNPKNFEEWILSQLGEDIYRKFYYGYTKKQWGTEPKNISISVAKRLPIRFTYNNNYFNDIYQGIPIGGYTRMIGNMIDHPNIDIKLGEEFKSNWEGLAKNLVYTGGIDSFFDFKFGELEYRSLRFETLIKSGDIQGCAIVNHTEECIPFTRQIEHKHFEMKITDKSVITREYPDVWSRDKEAYYPVVNESSSKKYSQYLELSKGINNVFIGGRLGSFKYWDMDQTISSSIKLAKSV